MTRGSRSLRRNQNSHRLGADAWKGQVENPSSGWGSQQSFWASHGSGGTSRARHAAAGGVSPVVAAHGAHAKITGGAHGRAQAQEEAVSQPQPQAQEAAQAQPQEKKPRKRKVLVGVLAGVAAVLVAAYCGGVAYYSSHFLPNTQLCDVDVSNKTSDEVSAALTQKAQGYSLSISGNGFSLQVSAEDMGLRYDVDAIVQKARSETDPWAWPVDLVSKREVSVSSGNPTAAQDGEAVAQLEGEGAEVVATTSLITYDVVALHETLTAALDEFNEGASRTTDAHLALSGTAVVVAPESQGTYLIPEVVEEQAGSAIEHLSDLVLDDSSLEAPGVLSTDAGLIARAESANGLGFGGVNFAVTLNGSEIARVTMSTIFDWLVYGDSNQAYLSDAAIGTWAYNLAARNKSTGSECTWVRGDGKVCSVGATYSAWTINNESLAVEVRDAVEALRDDALEVPTYGDASGTTQGKYWGNRYFDVDLSEQHARFYDDDGSLIFECDVVTGKKYESPTPSGVYQFNSKGTNVTLVGADYATLVSYWMPFIGAAYGVHDATWQPGFGGNMYAEGYGSHGCVNVSLGSAATLYGIVRVGDYIVIHW